jgi:uncharacterized protein (UPF0333 family)
MNRSVQISTKGEVSMTILKMVCVFVVTMAMAVSLFAMPRQESAKQDMKDAGHSTKQAAKDTGKATKKTAKDTGHEVKKDTKKTTHKAAKKTDEGAKKVEDKTKTE